MPLDSRIPLSFQPAQIESPLAQYGQMVQLYNAMQQQKANQMKLAQEEAQRRAMQGLPPDASDEQILRATRPFMSPEALGKSLQSSQDRKATIEAANINAQAQREQRIHEIEMRGQQEIARVREAAAQQRITKEEADRREAAMRETMIRLTASLRPPTQGPEPIKVQDEQGNVKLFDRGGNLIRDLGKVAAPSVAAQKAESERVKNVRNINEAISELGKAVKDGGLIDQSTGSGAGAFVDKAAAFVGQATPGAIAVGQLQPIYDIVLKMVPRFEGPQSDKDTQSYKEASGQLANPNIPNPQKKEAAKTILRLMTKRRDQFGAKDSEITPPPSGGGGVKFLGFEK